MLHERNEAHEAHLTRGGMPEHSETQDCLECCSATGFCRIPKLSPTGCGGGAAQNPRQSFLGCLKRPAVSIKNTDEL